MRRTLCRRLLCATYVAMTFLLPVSMAQGISDETKLKKINILTNYTFHGRHSPFFVGLEKGFYRKAGFDVNILPAAGSGAVISAVESRKADYGMADAGPVVQAVSKGAKIKGISVFMDRTTMGLASVKPFSDLESLKNSKIAASQADSARVILPILLKRNGLSDMSIDWQTGDASVYASLLMSGQVDSFTASIDGDIPALEKIAKARGEKVHFSSYADWGYEVYGYWLITSISNLINNRDETEAFVKATREAVLYSIDHPEETAKIMVKHNTTLNYDTTLTQWRQSMKAIDTPYVAKNGYGAATEQRLESTIQTISEALNLPKNIGSSDVFDNVHKADAIKK